MRIQKGVQRAQPFTVLVDGEALEAYPGETLATVMLEQASCFRQDTRDTPRGLFCNMGTCCECTVLLTRAGGPVRQVRACLVTAEPDMEIRRA